MLGKRELTKGLKTAGVGRGGESRGGEKLKRVGLEKPRTKKRIQKQEPIRGFKGVWSKLGLGLFKF